MSDFLDIEPAYRAALAAAGLTTFDAFMRAKAGIPTSKHAFRETAPIEIMVNGSPQRFFLKRNFRIPPKHAFIPLLRLQWPFTQPRREWDVIKSLSEAGIPVMKRVAVGERRIVGIPSVAFLLVEAVPMRCTLEEWLVPGFQRSESLDTEKQASLFRAIGTLLRRLDGAGYHWPDLHPKHIFAAPSDSGGWTFTLIDVERMTRKPNGAHEKVPSTLRTLVRAMRPFQLSKRNLESLAEGYGLSSDATRRLDFNYAPRLPDDYEHPRAIEWLHHEGLIVNIRVRDDLAQVGITDLSHGLSDPLGETLGKPGLDGHRQRIRLRVPGMNGFARTLYLKRYHHPPLGEQLRRMAATGLFRSSASHETRFIKKLGILGIPTLRTLARGQRMHGPWEEASFAITEGLNGISLETLVNEMARGDQKGNSGLSVRDRHDIARQLGYIVRLLHEAEYFHRDLYLCHVFLTRNRDGAIVLRVIDLARMIERPLNPGRWRIKDLAALQYSAPSPIVTRADRMRFMRAYYGANASKELMRSDIHRVAAKTRRIAAHDAKRRARLTPGVGA